MAGVGVVVFEGLGAEGESLLGDLAVLGAAGGVGACSVASMPLLERHSPLTVATYPIVFSVPLLVVLSLPQGLSLE